MLDANDPVGRSGKTRATVSARNPLSPNVGPVSIDVPRDRDGTFTSVIVKKRQRRLTGMDNIVLSLTAKGSTSGEISLNAGSCEGGCRTPPGIDDAAAGLKAVFEGQSGFARRRWRASRGVP